MNEQNLSPKYIVEEYRARINRVIDHIEGNYDRNLTLRELAEVASFSPYHFHRVFRSTVGETLYSFIQRLRLEKAAIKLVRSPRQSITSIGLECGFSNSSAFARAFRDRYATTASQWRSGGYKQYSKNGILESNRIQLLGNIEQDYLISLRYNQNKSDYYWRIEMKDEILETDVEVKDMPEMTIAYIRHIGPYQGDSGLFGELFNKMFNWAGPRDLLRFPETKVMAIYYDDPDITDDSKLRLDVCITVPSDTEVDGEVGKSTIPAGKYAIAHFEISPDQYGAAWNTVYSAWLPQSGYQPADGPCYELCSGDMESYAGDKHIVDICVAVKPL
jgi:AraC family transcriptional regulator